MSLLGRFAKQGNYDPEEPVAIPATKEEIRMRLKSFVPAKPTAAQPESEFVLDIGRAAVADRFKNAEKNAQQPKG